MGAEVCRDPRANRQICKLVDLGDCFRRWGFDHATTVERLAGLERGSAGTGGVSSREDARPRALP